MGAAAVSEGGVRSLWGSPLSVMMMVIGQRASLAPMVGSHSHRGCISLSFAHHFLIQAHRVCITDTAFFLISYLLRPLYFHAYGRLTRICIRQFRFSFPLSFDCCRYPRVNERLSMSSLSVFLHLSTPVDPLIQLDALRRRLMATRFGSTNGKKTRPQATIGASNLMRSSPSAVRQKKIVLWVSWRMPCHATIIREPS